MHDVEPHTGHPEPTLTRPPDPQTAPGSFRDSPPSTAPSSIAVYSQAAPNSQPLQTRSGSASSSPCPTLARVQSTSEPRGLSGSEEGAHRALCGTKLLVEQSAQAVVPKGSSAAVGPRQSQSKTQNS